MIRRTKTIKIFHLSFFPIDFFSASVILLSVFLLTGVSVVAVVCMLYPKSITTDLILVYFYLIGAVIAELISF